MERDVITQAGANLTSAQRLAQELRFVAWFVFGSGLVAIAWTWFENLDDFGPGGSTQFLLGLGVPVVLCWGVLRGIAAILLLRVDTVLVEAEDDDDA